MTDKDDKKKQMMTFWTERVKKFKEDPRANTNDIWLREVEIEAVSGIISHHKPKKVLDFGCANGYTTIRVAKKYPDCQFVGIDINSDMISVAKDLAKSEKVDNVLFFQKDVLSESVDLRFDFVFGIRVFQNIEGLETQRSVFDKLYELIKPGGLFYFIESYAAGYEIMNADRQKMGLSLLPIHPHLTLLTGEFDGHVESKMKLVEFGWPSSSYYLITRLLYSYIAMKNGEPIDYNHPIHQVASMVPNVGEYGPQKSGLYQKTGPAPYS